MDSEQIEDFPMEKLSPYFAFENTNGDRLTSKSDRSWLLLTKVRNFVPKQNFCRLGRSFDKLIYTSLHEMKLKESLSKKFGKTGQ